MNLFVVEIRHDGLVLAGPGSHIGAYWFPASECDETAGSWQDFRDMAEPGMALNVSLVPGRFFPGGLKAVTLRGLDAKELSLEWKGEIHALKVESMSKNLIRGRIGAVEAVMERQEYTDFLNGFPRNDHIQDHGALALADVVCGVFKAEQGPEGRVQVSFTDALELIENECEERVRRQSGHADGAPEEAADATHQRHGPLFHTPPEALSPFLFVEDDDMCRQMWSATLAATGVEVHAYGTYEEALRAIRDAGRRYKMAILDVHLRPGATDHLGLHLAQSLVGSQPDCRIVLSSAEDAADHTIENWGAIQVHGYITKPALLEDWAATIDAAASTAARTPLHELLSDSETHGTATGLHAPPKQHVFSRTIRDALDAFCREAPGTIVHVFRLHPRSWRGRSVANAGGKLNWEPCRGKLGKSLIRDAAESNDAVVYNEVREAWRHLWTKAMVDYQSFWGQRLQVPGHYEHVLVAFHSASGFFTPEMQLRARCCAETVTRLLAAQQLERRGVHDAEHSSAGMAFACLAHEIYSTLNGIEMAVKRMASLLSASDAALGDSASALRQIVTSLECRVPDLVANARILRGPAGGDKSVSIAFCLEKALAGIREAKGELLRRPENVAVDMEMPAPKPRWMTKANAGALVAAFFNVLLNAVQQIEMFSAVRPKGWVRMATQYQEDAHGLPWALVFITDSGPGIHPDDWERVFDAGYTTKEDGTGLGLHICRQLLSRVRDGTRQASIRIARSVLWAGTTMVIRLPLSVTKE